MKRQGIKYPKFKDQFALMDFEAEPMPALSLFPVPSTVSQDGAAPGGIEAKGPMVAMHLIQCHLRWNFGPK